MSETYSTDGPICPHCGRQYCADEGHYFDEQNYTEQECDECGTTFAVRVYTSTSWTCAPMPPSVPMPKMQTKDMPFHPPPDDNA